MTEPNERNAIVPIKIEDEVRSSYMDYAMSIIIGRALPDVRDGLKPVHRRILFTMYEQANTHSRPYKKSARIVGDVMGKYHPHGDSAIYDALVRMAQPFSMRVPLADGQGNFGSVDGDPAAAMRYTEVRMTQVAGELLSDIEKDTVDFGPNYDGQQKEPRVLPARIPNLLINGSEGIAVGMATRIPPHNLREVVSAAIHLIANPHASLDDLLKIVPGPDFPTGGFMYRLDGIRSAYETGRGIVKLRARTEIESDDRTGKSAIIVTELPFQVNKARLLERIAQMVREKAIEGITDLRDESDRRGMRMVIELRRDMNPQVVLNHLFKRTALETSFGINMLAIVAGQPRVLSLKEILEHFLDFRRDVVTRRTLFELRKAQDRLHILEALKKAVDMIDEVIRTIRASSDGEEARGALMALLEIDRAQAQAILDMRLQRLTGLERDKIREEHAELMKTIAYLKEVLADEGLRMKIIKEETLEVKEKYGDKRRTEIMHASGDVRIEDLIADEAVVVTISHLGYIKRTSLNEFRTQSRGGVGSRGSTTRDEDFLEHLFVATNHNYLLVFTQKGRCYWMRVFDIPEGNRQSKGRAIQNLVQIEGDDKVVAYLNVTDLNSKDYINNHFVVLCTKQGIIKKTTLEAYSRPRANGIIAVGIREGDELLEARLTTGKSHIILASKDGRAVHFEEGDVRPMGRNASGVRGMNLEGGSEGNEVIGMIAVDSADLTSRQVLVVSENGYGKRSAIAEEVDGKIEYEYRMVSRGGKGVKTIQVTEKTGNLVAIKDVHADDQLMIITRNGITIRMDLSEMRVLGRATQGVRLIELRNNDQIAAVAKVDSGLKEDEEATAPDSPAPDPSDNATETDGTEVASSDDQA